MRLSIDGPCGPLETVVEEGESTSSCYAVICHPHPLYGGTMDNKVVTTVARALRDLGMASLRFNFRGVGTSAGVYDEGRGETDDAAAVARFGALRWPGRKVLIAGFSFGAYVALRLAQRRDAGQLILIAPPVKMLDFGALMPPSCPWTVLQGDADEVVEPRSVRDWVDSQHPRPRFVDMPGAGHFFHGRLQELREAVVDTVRSDVTPLRTRILD